MNELTHWIKPGSAVRGWYTCEKTGKKMRGQEAEAQLALQAQWEASKQQAATTKEDNGVKQQKPVLVVGDTVIKAGETVAPTLTTLETKVFGFCRRYLNDWDGEQDASAADHVLTGYSDLAVTDLADALGMKQESVKGVLGSLMGKSLLGTDEHEGITIIYLTGLGWKQPVVAQTEAPEGEAIITRPDEQAIGLPEGSATVSLEDAMAMKDAAAQVERVTLSSGKEVTASKTITITCCEEGCGQTRVIKPQDVFQVKRCVDCQKKHRNKLRAQKQKGKRANKKAEGAGA